ncbi:MAG TPA: polysaccharide deacetylase family protein [Mucilaginibacter sp.]
MKHICLGGCLVLCWLVVSAFTRQAGPGAIKNIMVASTVPDSIRYVQSHGAIIRGDIARKQIALVFTGDEFADGGTFIAQTLKEDHIRGSFFLTGNFYRNKKFRLIIKKLADDGNFMGVHSDQHLLYCDWKKRDSLLVTHREFVDDLHKVYAELKKLNIPQDSARFFLPPYEWYNDTIARWTSRIGLQLVNFTPGTRSNADYTYPGMGSKYLDSETIYQSIMSYEHNSANGLNGFLLLVHIGTDPRRTDKFYARLPKLIEELKKLGYEFVRIDVLLSKK